MKPQAFKLSKEDEKVAIEKIRTYFAENMEEQIGDFAAALFLDFLINNIGTIFYNQGVADAHTYIMGAIEDLYGLLK